MGLSLVLIVFAIGMAMSEGTSEGSKSMYIHLYAGTLSTLYYYGGNCTWRISGVLGRHDLEILATHIGLKNMDTGIKILCEVNGDVLLQAEVITHDTLPPPCNVVLDLVDKVLQWDHPFLPQLPQLFELVNGFTITYQVYAKEDGVEMPSLSVLLFSNYFNLTSKVTNLCAEYEFEVQAVSNLSYVLPSQNSSAVSGYFIDAPSFRQLSAIPDHTQHQQRLEYLTINVTFALEEEDCQGTYPTFFIVNLEGYNQHRFNVTRMHIDEGKATFQLPLTDPISNISDLNVIIFGGNDAGYGTTCIHSGGSDVKSGGISTIYNHTIRPTNTALNPSSSPTTIATGPTPQSTGNVTDGNNPSQNGFILRIVLGTVLPLGLLISLAVISLGAHICYKRKQASKNNKVNGHHQEGEITRSTDSTSPETVRSTATTHTLQMNQHAGGQCTRSECAMSETNFQSYGASPSVDVYPSNQEPQEEKWSVSNGQHPTTS